MILGFGNLPMLDKMTWMTWKTLKDTLESYLESHGIDPNAETTQIVYLDFFPNTRRGALIIEYHKADNGVVGISVSNDNRI